MGYTHYWTFTKPKGIKVEEIEAKYKQAIFECSKVALHYNSDMLKVLRPEDRLSGYSAHCKPGKYGGFKINGKGDNAHEDFTLREHYMQNIGQDNFNFCKTAMKPYDIVVTACLAILKYRLGDAIQVSSDGDASDWEAGTKLACKVLRRKVLNPIGSICNSCTNCSGCKAA
jgi:hypothetical protein